MNLIKEFHSKINGNTFIPNGQELLLELKSEDLLIVRREPENKFDANAIMVLNTSGIKLGYIPKDTAINLAKDIDNDEYYVSVMVSEITGGGTKNIGCNIIIKIYDNAKGAIVTEFGGHI